MFLAILDKHWYHLVSKARGTPISRICVCSHMWIPSTIRSRPVLKPLMTTTKHHFQNPKKQTQISGKYILGPPLRSYMVWGLSFSMFLPSQEPCISPIHGIALQSAICLRLHRGCSRLLSGKSTIQQPFFRRRESWGVISAQYFQSHGVSGLAAKEEMQSVTVDVVAKRHVDTARHAY